MCGIAGYVSAEKEADRTPLLRRLATALHHRGPDDEGFCVEPGVGLAMRRLSIVDLVSSRQPISNEDGPCRLLT